ncbi:HAMP domain-containing protein [Ramlibacter sp. RBP-2]|uniref:HAMP domain-containing protein n=1 Tax=Ramlibacter lithotrophicus TaxID=2606681 RepID=A0A7X6DFE7_9BURK|nr:methyl-accepting chemotaxis protein [Ramlibacter lithotrophicus]NKE66170.1 HAMP domain-containing protein [Ramlibacter lithotrophicus]
MKNWKIATRMALGFGLVLALLTASSVIGVFSFMFIGQATGELVDRAVPMERVAREWLQGTVANLARTVAMAKTSDQDLEAFLQKEISAASAQISGHQKKLESMISTAEEKALMAQIANKRAAYLDARKAVMKAKADGNTAQARQLVEQGLVPAVAAYEADLTAMVEMQVKDAAASAGKIEHLRQRGELVLVVVGAAAVLLGLAVAWTLTRAITRPLRRAVALAETVAAGDLTTTVAVDSRDETGQLLQSLKDMSGSLAQVVAQVRAGTDAISTASGQIASGNQDLSQRTEEQAASLEETAASMEELTGTVKQNADNARQANQLAQLASEVAVKGGSVVGQVVDTMGGINAASRKIADIITVIDGIAFQTNILALNAAVEAARAGEQGRGFAVVASEVRSLAQRSAAAAKEIKALIDDSVSKVDTGSELVGQAGATMDEIVGSIRRVTDIMGEIAAASAEQTRGIEQVNQAITQMDQVTQQNAALVEEASAAAQSMREQAGALVQAVSVFKVDAMATVRSLAPAARPAQAAARRVAAAHPAAGKLAATAQKAIPAGQREPALAASGKDEWAEF